MQPSFASHHQGLSIQENYFEWGFLQPYIDLSVFKYSGLNEVNDLALQMPELIKDGCFRKAVMNIAPLNANQVPTHYLPRAKLILSMLAQAFAWCNGEDEQTNYIPASIAIPLVGVSERLGEPPIFNYADYILRNTQLIRPTVHNPSQFKSIYTFTGMKSEFGFILSHVWYELKGREAIREGLNAIKATENNDVEITKSELVKLYTIILELIDKFNTVYETTKEKDFRENFRIFLKGWKEIIPDMIYQGVEINAKELRGETGAQSSLLPFLDSVAGVSQTMMDFSPLYGAWRRYMPKADREFISEIGMRGKQLRAFVSVNPSLIEVYNNVLNGLIAFRKNHLVTITQYIEGKNSYTSGGVGTGGSFYSIYLGGLIKHLESLKF